MKGERGARPPVDPVLMFKVLVIQATNNLSDVRTEFLIADRVPDARTIWLFREKPRRCRATRTRYLEEPAGDAAGR